MIVFENAPQPYVRAGEFDLAGRRVTARAFPYGGGAFSSAPWSFDPIERLFHLPAAQGRIEVGPHDPEAWRDALARNPAGSVAIGAGHSAEEIRGAYRAAAQGAAGAGRGVFLIDPPASGLPQGPSEAFVAAFVMLPGRPAPEGLAEAHERGFLAGVIVPLVPGWTCEVPALQGLIERAEESGARFVAGVPAAEDGPGRRAVVEMRARLEPESPDEFFERVHHGDWRAETEDARARIREACGGRSLSFGMPRPVGHLEPAANARAARQLEDRAEALFAQNEHRASLLHAAARWIEESGRDLAPIVAEGNFGKIFPFADEIAREAEAAFHSEP